MLNRVTITGADDSTDIAEMVAISQEYPFVEWGILVGTMAGVDRFPSIEWIRQLIEARCDLPEGSSMHLSLHVCGSALYDIVVVGKSNLDVEIGPRVAAFERWQLNFHGQRQPVCAAENILAAFCKLCSHGYWEPTVIFQLDGVNDDLWMATARRYLCAGLFDRSHGAGVLPGEWPEPSCEFQCGWAGGLGPDNLATELPKIHAKAFRAVDYWVDMETNVRSHNGKDDHLDMAKVRRCLSIAEQFMAGTI